MNWAAQVRSECARLAKHIDDSVVEEMAQHAAAAYEAARADGTSAADAEAASIALIQSWCGDTSGPRRIVRDPLLRSASAGASPFAGLWLDIRLAVRLMFRQPGFTLLSITLIALAIAATTSLFSVVNDVILRPLPRVKMEGLVRVIEVSSQTEGRSSSLTNAAYYAWRDNATTVEGLAVWNEWSLVYEGPSGFELIRGARITANLFPLIGVSPAIGVHFTEEQEITDDAAMLSYGFWQERLGGSLNVLGTRLTLGGQPRTIVGVMPRGFHFPDREARIWLAARPPSVIESVKTIRGGKSVSMRFSQHNGLARLKPGVTPEQAAAEATARAGAASPRHFNPNRPFGRGIKRNIGVTPMLEWMIKDVKPALWILSAAVVLLFAAAIGNVANMQLSRATTRRREVAIRSAIGAGGGRLVRQLLVETTIIAAIGAIAGVGIAAAVLRALPALMPEDFLRLDGITIDRRVLGVAVGLTVAISLIMCLMPARLSRRVKLANVLAEDGAAPVGHSLRSPAARSRALIITGQVAIAALLLVGAGLLGQSLVKLIAVDRGYEAANLLTARLAHLSQGLPPSAKPQFYDDVLARLQATPGVTHAALSNDLPLTSTGGSTSIGRLPADLSETVTGRIHVVSTDYFAAMGIRLVRGRGFTRDDVRTSPPVVVVNETFARLYLAGEPLGAVVPFDLDADRPCSSPQGMCTNPWLVVGVVGDVRQSDAEAGFQPEVFAVRSQMISPMPATQYVAVRTAGDPAALAHDLRAIVKEASANGAIDEIMTMETRLMTSLARPRLYAMLLGGFAVFALLIAVIGLFGGLSYGVAQRTREFGVRTALGATPRDIMVLVLKQGTIITIAGLAIGFGLAAATVQYLSQYLFGVAPLDPTTFAAAGTLLAALALAACAIPARRAARIDAIDALRD